MSFKIEVKADEVEAALRELGKKVTDLKPVFDDIGELLLYLVHENFENESASDGKEWEELSPRYLDYKEKVKKEKKLQLSGRLADSIDFASSSDHLILGSNLEYAPIHQFGGFAGRDKSSYIPARPYLPITKNEEFYSEVVEEILSMLKEYIKT